MIAFCLFNRELQVAEDADDDSSNSNTESDLDPRSVTPLARTRLKRQETKQLASTHVQPVKSKQSKVSVAASNSATERIEFVP